MIALATTPWGKFPLDLAVDALDRQPAVGSRQSAALKIAGAVFDAPEGCVMLSDQDRLTLQLMQAATGRSLASLVSEAINAYALAEIGIARLADASIASRAEGAPAGRAIWPGVQSDARPAAEHFCVGRAAVASPELARLRRRGKSHKPEGEAQPNGSNLAPATTIARGAAPVRLARPPAPDGDGTTVGAQPGRPNQGAPP